MTRRKYFPPELKRRVVDEVKAGSSISAAARRYGINRDTVSGWLAEDQAGTLMNEISPISSSATANLIDEVNRLKQLLGEKELENEILKDLVKKTAQRSGTKPK